MNSGPVWLLLLAGGLAARTPYVPDLKHWRLELTSAPGGWLSERRQQITFKLVDPGDPRPPREPAGRYDPYADAEAYRPPAAEEKTPEQLRRKRQQEEALRLANQWRQRTIQIWFNGEPMAEYAEVNAARSFRVESQDGENRLELLEPESGARVTCSWWVSVSQSRLQVTVLRDFPGNFYPTGELQVVEPDGTLGDYLKATPSGGKIQWMAYSHPAPPAGTYAVRWKTYPWQEPAAVTVQVVLDPGTDREHRWRLNRLILPGSPPTLLGTFDVDP